jgi:hypothetical protein
LGRFISGSLTGVTDHEAHEPASVLDLPDGARATPAEARAASPKLLGFLRRAGYDLAVVRAKAQGEQITGAGRSGCSSPLAEALRHCACYCRRVRL